MKNKKQTESVRERMDAEIEDAVRAQHRKDGAIVFYSAYKSDKDDEPIYNLDKVAVKGKAVFVREGDEFWGGKKALDYKSAVVENPTWLQLAVIADEAIRITRDEHHVFFEGIENTKKKMDGIKVYELIMGS